MTEVQHAPDPPMAVGGELRLPKAPGVVRRFWARHPRLADGLIAGVYVVPTLFVWVIAASTQAQPPLWLTLAHVAAVGAAGAALLFRRTRPGVLLAAGWLTCLVSAPSGALDAAPILFALYALAVYRSPRSAWIGLAISIGVGASSAYSSTWYRTAAELRPIGPEPSGMSVGLAVSMLIATLIGVTVGNRRRYLDALIARAHDLARERDQQAQLAGAMERARIAREMHDIVSHGLTVMITLAEGSAATAARDPDRAADAMRHVAEAGRDALGEMRRMLGVLAGPADAAADRSPQPDVAAIPALVAGFREAGLPVRLTTSGSRITEPALQLTVYRLVQEGLTNALRHAEGARRVDVVIRRTEEAVSVTIDDDANDPTTRIPGAGRGLAGLQERVGLYGGLLEAGPLPHGGWRLQAVLRVASDQWEQQA